MSCKGCQAHGDREGRGIINPGNYETFLFGVAERYKMMD